MGSFETQAEDYKVKYSKGFELLNSFGDDPEAPEITEQINSMKLSLEQGEVQPLVDHITKMIETNMLFIRGDIKESEEDKDRSRFEIVKDLLDALEQLKQEN